MPDYLQMFQYERLATKLGPTRSKSVKVNQSDMMTRCKGDKRKENPLSFGSPESLATFGERDRPGRIRRRPAGGTRASDTFTH